MRRVYYRQRNRSVNFTLITLWQYQKYLLYELFFHWLLFFLTRRLGPGYRSCDLYIGWPVVFVAAVSLAWLPVVCEKTLEGTMPS